MVICVYWQRVTSRVLCQGQEEWFSGFIFKVFMGEDGIEDSLHAGFI
jgi:hypothetical protein